MEIVTSLINFPVIGNLQSIFKKFSHEYIVTPRSGILNKVPHILDYIQVNFLTITD